jgi:hypothetical protein
MSGTVRLEWIGAARKDGLERVSRDVKRFIAGNIDSVGQLEVLLLVRSDPERYWSATEVSRALRSGRTWAEVQLEYLRVEGLLGAGEINDPRYRYDPARPELEPVITRVSEAFESQRAEVIRLVFSQRPSERLRTFSEAFRLRKEQ